MSPELEVVARLWNEKRRDRLYPGRDDFSIRDLKGVLRNLAFLEIRPSSGDERYFVRYMGSELDIQMTPMTGKHSDEVLPPHLRVKWHALWKKASERNAPCRSLTQAEFRPREFSFAESLLAPLSSHGENPDMLMIVVMYNHINSTDSGERARAQKLKEEFRTGRAWIDSIPG